MKQALSPPAGWSLQRHPLRIAVGDFYLRTAAIDLMVRETHFTRLSEGLAAATETPLPEGIDGALIPSLPYAGPPFRIRRHDGLVLYAPRAYTRYWVDTTGPYDAYVAAFSSKTRATLRRKVRKFSVESEVCDFRVYRTATELVDFHAMARELSARTYQERLIDAGLPETPEFLADMRARGSRNAARGYLLLRDGVPAAYTYCPIDDGVALYAYTGYDPALGHLSPGTVLQWLLLADLFADPVAAMFDFTQGEGPHKQLFATDNLPCMDLYVLRPSWGIWRVILLQTAIERAVDRLGQVLDATGLKPRVRRLLRRAP